jgi:hypothetical protein
VREYQFLYADRIPEGICYPEEVESLVWYLRPSEVVKLLKSNLFLFDSPAEVLRKMGVHRINY